VEPEVPRPNLQGGFKKTPRAGQGSQPQRHGRARSAFGFRDGGPAVAVSHRCDFTRFPDHVRKGEKAALGNLAAAGRPAVDEKFNRLAFKDSLLSMGQSHWRSLLRSRQVIRFRFAPGPFFPIVAA